MPQPAATLNSSPQPQPQHTYYCVESWGSSSSSDHSTRVGGVTSCGSGSAVQCRQQGRSAPPRSRISAARVPRFSLRAATAGRRHPTNPPDPELTNQSITCRDGTMPHCLRARARPSYLSREAARHRRTRAEQNEAAEGQESAKAFSAARRSRFPARTTSRSARGRG